MRMRGREPGAGITGRREGGEMFDGGHCEGVSCWVSR